MSERSNVEVDDQGLLIMDRDKPRSLYNMVPDSMRRALDEIPPKYLSMSENQLIKKLKPTITLKRVRIAFWQEYYRAMDKGDRFSLFRSLSGLCTNTWWYSVCLKNPLALAFVVTPVANYEKTQDELYHSVLDRIREAVEVSPVYKDAKTKQDRVDASHFSKLIEVFKMLDLRKHGAVVQEHKHQIEKKSVNLNVAAVDAKDLDSQIAQLEERLGGAGTESSTEIIDATLADVLDIDVDNG